MKRVVILIIIIVTGWTYVHAQNVGINDDGSDPDAAAMLDVKSTSKGILIPRIDYNNKPATPPTGLLIFVTANGPDGNNAFYFYNGSSWEKVAGGAGSDSDWTISGDNMYSAVSGNVGIGTTAPASDLDIKDTGDGALIWLTRTDGTPGEIITEIGSTANYGIVGTRSANALKFRINSQDKMYIGTDGKVGIGNTSPAYNLDVTGSINYTGTLYQNGSPLSVTGLWSTGTGGIHYSSGNVGVGITSPIGTFHSLKAGSNNYTYYDTYASTASSASLVGLRRSKSDTGGANTSTADGDILGTIAYYGNSGAGFTNGALIQGIQEGTAGTYTPTSLRILTSDGTNNWLERMRINSAGNVGIGTTSPSTLLDVNGTVRFRDGAQEGYILTSDANGNATWQPQVSGDPMPTGWTVSGENVYSSGSGNVGIGTTTPLYNLEVSNTGSAAEIEVTRTDGAQGLLKATATSVMIGARSNNALMLNVNNATKMTIDTDGKVGIGTTTPAYNFDVTGDINLTGTLYQNGSPLSVTGLWSAVTGGINYGSGNVGIGTTTPSRKLSIDGTLSQLGISSSGVERFVASISANIVDLNPLPDATGATAVRFFRTTNTTGTKRIDFLKGDGTATTQARIGVDGQNSFFQVGGGNLGIGTSGPESTLDVEGTVSFKQGSMTASSDAFDVSGATSFTVNSTTGNIVLGGLSGGVQGQIVYLAKITSTNSLTIEHNESTGTQKIICPAGVDLVFNNYGGVTLLCSGSLWYVVSMAQ